MAGTRSKEDFKNDNYNDHYRNHKFEPIAESNNAHRILARVGWAMDFVENNDVKTVLDLGCLDGYTLLTLAHHYGITGTGVDLSEEGIQIARERSGEGLNFVNTSIEDYLSSTDEKFDLIIMFEVIEHVLDPKDITDMMENLLAPGGSVMITTPDYDGAYGKANYDPLHVRIYTSKPNHFSKDAIPIESIIPKGKKGQELFVNDGLIQLRY